MGWEGRRGGITKYRQKTHTAMVVEISILHLITWFKITLLNLSQPPESLVNSISGNDRHNAFYSELPVLCFGFVHLSVMSTLRLLCLPVVLR